MLQHQRSRATDANAADDSAMAIATGDDKNFLIKAKAASNICRDRRSHRHVQYEIIALRDRDSRSTARGRKHSMP